MSRLNHSITVIQKVDSKRTETSESEIVVYQSRRVNFKRISGFSLWKVAIWESFTDTVGNWSGIEIEADSCSASCVRVIDGDATIEPLLIDIGREISSKATH